MTRVSARLIQRYRKPQLSIIFSPEITDFLYIIPKLHGNGRKNRKNVCNILRAIETLPIRIKRKIIRSSQMLVCSFLYLLNIYLWIAINIIQIIWFEEVYWLLIDNANFPTSMLDEAIQKNSYMAIVSSRCLDSLSYIRIIFYKN